MFFHVDQEFETPDLAPTVRVFNGSVLSVVDKTTQKKLAPDVGADAKVI